MLRRSAFVLLLALAAPLAASRPARAPAEPDHPMRVRTSCFDGRIPGLPESALAHSVGTLQVVVTDEVGVPVDGAEVEVRTDGSVRSATTGPDGVVTFDRARAGLWSGNVHVPGQVDFGFGYVQVEVGARAITAVQVVADLPSPAPWAVAAETVNTADTRNSEVLTRDMLTRLPTGRSYQGTVLLSGVEGQGGNPNIAGGATHENTVLTEAPTAGNTVYLSNDDSMSLASAQRVIYALQHRLPIRPAEIRPHELLNYFGFDAPTPTRNETFALGSSAVRDGDRLSLAIAVQGAVPARRPLDLTLVVDRSGSMSQDGRMTLVRRALTRLSEQLRDGDRVDLVVFDHQACTALEDFEVGRDDPAALSSVLAAIRPRGGTNLEAGLRTGYAAARADVGPDGRNHRVMLMTDAILNVGQVDPALVSEIGRDLDDSGIRLTGVGVGRDFRDDVLDQLTEKGKGAYVFLGSEAVADRMFGDEFPSLTETIAHDVRFALELPDGLVLERFYGEEHSTDAADVQPVHFHAGSRQLFLQDLEITRALRPTDPLKMTIRFRDPDTDAEQVRVFTTTVGAALAADPANVHKARALMAWSDLLLARALNGDPCGAPLETWQARAARVPDDAEIRFVDDLVRRVCPAPRAVATRVPLKLRVDSDAPIDEVSLMCGSLTVTRPLSAVDTVARFDALPGPCTVALGGVRPIRLPLDVPAAPGDVRCVVRGGRGTCAR